MMQIGRNLTDPFDGRLVGKRFLIMDRDRKYCDAFRALLHGVGVETVRLPARSPNLDAHAERRVLFVKAECLDRLILFGQRSLRRALSCYLTHYHEEQNLQGLNNRLIDPAKEVGHTNGDVQCRERLGGMLRYYYRQAA